MKPVAPKNSAREQTRGGSSGSDRPSLGNSVAAWALLLNGVWEYAQCALFYDMHRTDFWQGALLMAVAVGGDVLVLVALYEAVASWESSRSRRQSWRPTGPWGLLSWGSLVALSLAAAVLLEYLAVAAGLWHYNARMETIRVAGERIGWSPLLQITFLPALSVWLAGRRPLFQPRRARPLS